MALCTLSDLKSWLGIDTLDTSKDTILTMIINSVSKKYENYCGTKLEETTIVNELYEGSGNTNSLVLNNLNVSKVNKIEFLIKTLFFFIFHKKFNYKISTFICIFKINFTIHIFFYNNFRHI